MPKCLPLSSAFMMPDCSAGRNGLTCWHKLATDANAGNLDGGDDYYSAWLAALRPCYRADVAGAPEIEQMVADWRRAYLETPHGNPVRLAR